MSKKGVRRKAEKKRRIKTEKIVKGMPFVNCLAEAITKLYFCVCVDHTLKTLSIHDRLGVDLVTCEVRWSPTSDICVYIYIS